MFIKTLLLCHIPRDSEGGAGAAGGDGGEGGAAPAPTLAAPWANSAEGWNIGDGEGARPWTSFIAEEPARDFAVAQGWKNPGEMALAAYAQSEQIAQFGNAIVPPGPDATPEQISDFHKKLGRPDDKTMYEFKTPDGVKVDDGMMEFGRGLFFDLGLNPAQAQQAFDRWNAYAAEANASAVETRSKENDQAIAALETEWGGKLQENKTAGLAAMKAMGLDSTDVDAIEAHIGAAPIIKLLATIGSKMGEGGFVPGDATGSAEENLSAAAAEAKIAELMGDKDFYAKYNDKNHPQHKEAVQRVLRLHART